MHWFPAGSRIFIAHNLGVFAIDPPVLDAFKDCVRRFRDIFEAHRDDG